MLIKTYTFINQGFISNYFLYPVQVSTHFEYARISTFFFSTELTALYNNNIKF